MKKSILVLSVLMFFGLSAAPVFAATTITVDNDDQVSVSRTQAVPVTVVQTVPTAVVVERPVVVVSKNQDPRDLEGEIIRVDYTGNQIIVQDVDGREHRVDMKQGMIGSYKVGDYVKIHLMADLREAKTISTRQTADLEGDIVAIDYNNSRMVVRDRSGVDRAVVFNPGTINTYKNGDHIRLYVVSDYPNFQEARIIRVK